LPLKVNITEKKDERRQVALVLMATEGEQSISLGEGYRPVWVRP